VAVALFQGLVGYVYARCGLRAKALAELDRVKADAARGRFMSHFGLAMIYMGLQDKPNALRELELDLQDVEWPMFTLRADPAFDSLRDDPRFAKVLAKVGLLP
jgi:hypothetical protein